MMRQPDMMQPLESPHPMYHYPQMAEAQPILPDKSPARGIDLSLNMDLINSGPQPDHRMNETPHCPPSMISPMSLQPVPHRQDTPGHVFGVTPPVSSTNFMFSSKRQFAISPNSGFSKVYHEKKE